MPLIGSPDGHVLEILDDVALDGYIRATSYIRAIAPPGSALVPLGEELLKDRQDRQIQQLAVRHGAVHLGDVHRGITCKQRHRDRSWTTLRILTCVASAPKSSTHGVVFAKIDKFEQIASRLPYPRHEYLGHDIYIYVADVHVDAPRYIYFIRVMKI